MEKLQAALERARESRKTEPTPRPARGPGDGTPPRSLDVEGRWKQLQPIEIDNNILEKNHLVTQVPNQRATPFDILRTKVLLQMRQNGWKRLAITSPMPNSGKTTMACNLALSLGRQRDLRTMVLDFDLRDPSIHKFLNHTPKHCISDVLSNKVSFAEQAVRVEENVAFALASHAEKDPARVLLAEETTAAIDTIDQEYEPDVMIFDLPSLLVNDDTRAFLKNVDCALIILRASKTQYAQFDESEREISEQTNVLGVVLNAFKYPTKNFSAG
jgi:protein-tyrosine kinase